MTEVNYNSMRICSFLPSATEILFILGVGSQVHAVSHECDFPREAKILPKIVRSRINSQELTSRQIDETVSDLISKGQNIYEIDHDVLADSRPDILFTQELCEVCAISLEDVRHAAERLDVYPIIASLDPNSIADVLNDIVRVGELIGASEEAKEVVSRLEDRIRDVKLKSSQNESVTRVACVEWLDPLMSAGHWIPDLVSTAGGSDVLAVTGSPSRRITFEELTNARPDILIFMPCGMDIEQGREQLLSVKDKHDWENMAAVQNGRVYICDAGSYFSRSGPRLVDGLEILAHVIDAESFESNQIKGVENITL